MIVIVSNGMEYSDHCLYFVEAPSAADVEAVLNTKRNPYARVVGTSDALRWHEVPYQCRTMSLAEFTKAATDGL